MAAPGSFCGLGLAQPSTPAGRALYGIYISVRFGVHRTYMPQARHCALYLLEARMLNAIFLTAGLAFFAVCVGYTLICEKL